jgi:hypothetical protein
MRNVVTPEAMLSYPALFEAKQTPSGDLKYSTALIFDKNADLSKLKAAVTAAAEERWGERAAAMIKAKQLRLPFRDGSEKAAVGYGPNTVFINVSSTRKPGIVSRYAGQDGKPLVIEDPDEIYPGAKVRASLTAFSYSVNGNNGVSFSLNNLQKLGDGPRLDGRLRAEDEFEAFEDAPANFDPATDDPMAA